MQNDVALIGRSGNVEKSDFVGTLLIVATGDFNRITGIAQPDKVGALDDTPCGDIKAGNNPFSEH